MTTATEMRGEGTSALQGLVGMLEQQRDVKVDEVVTASRLRMQDGKLHVVGGSTRLTLDGVETADAVLDPTDVFDNGVSEKLGIPRAYLRRMRESGQTVNVLPETISGQDVRLYDANVNGWLEAEPQRKFLLRSFRTDNPDDGGIARALLSDRYEVGYDNLDTLLAVLAGVREAGVQIDVHRCSLTEKQMRVMLTAPAITALAPTLLRNYRSPFDRRPGSELPVVWAGIDIRNSETGNSRFVLSPAMVVQICTNGMTRQTDAITKTHVGARLDEGVIRWSSDTVRAATEFTKSKAKDAVNAFLDPTYLARWVDEIEGKCAEPVTDAVGTIERVGQAHAFTEAEQAQILDFFIASGDLTAGGVMQAVTAAAQQVESPDRQAEMEDLAMAVLDTAAAG